MKDTNVVPSSVLGMLADLMYKLQHGSITSEQLEKFLKRRNPFAFVLPEELLQDWQNFYQNVFGLRVDLSKVKIPKPRGFDRLIVIPRGLTLARVIKISRKYFSVSCYWCDREEPDKVFNQNDRITDKSYAIWCRECREADEELENLSANELQDKRIPTMTLLERLIYGLKFYKETGEPLDVIRTTICASSRDANGNVPRVHWGGSYGTHVQWCLPYDANPAWRSRAVVSS